jgi:hypothetical protein
MGQPQAQGPIDPVTGQPMQIAKIYDLTVGKYDVTVDSGPSFTTRREEAANQMIDFIGAYPASAPIVGPLLAKNLDWPGSEEISDGLQQLAQQAKQGQSDPHAQAAQVAMQKAQADIQAKQQMAQSDIQIEQQKAQLQAQLAQQKLQADIELKRQQMQMELELQRQALVYSSQIKMAEAKARVDQTVELPTDTIGGDAG